MTLGKYHERESLGGGRYRHTQHLKPIAYLENGIYKLTDRNVVAYDDGTYHHAVLTANMGVRIGDDGRYAAHPTREMGRYVAFGGPVVKVGGVWTSVGFADPQRIGQSVLWSRPQADLTLTHLGYGLKEEIALKGGYEPEDGLIAFPVDLVGLTWDIETRALLADGEPVAWIREPYVYDADNEFDTRPITWELHSIAGQVYVLFHLPDLAGMVSPVVDPTLTLQPGAAAGDDSFIFDTSPTSNQGTSITILVGDNLATGNRSLRILIKFDLSSLPGSAIISAVTLSLYELTALGAGLWATNLHRLLKNWVELQVTWNIYSTGNNWATVGAGAANDDRDSDVSATVTLDGTASVAFVDWAGATLIDDVQKIANGTYANNYGWLLEAPTAEAAGAAQKSNTFASSDHGNAAQHPKLVVVYTVGGGGMLLLGVG